MKSRNTFFTALALALTLPAASWAQTFNNTGATGNVNGSFQDLKWEYSNNGGTSWTQAYQVQGGPGVWQANTAAYSWISGSTSGSGSGPNYLFRTFFDLTGYNASTAVLSFQCAIDNYVTTAGGFYSLNGGAYTGNCGSTPTSYQFQGVQTLNTGFLGGVNELRFAVLGDNTTDGLVVGNSQLSARPNGIVTPEPASFALMGAGLFGLGMAARRRKRA